MNSCPRGGSFFYKDMKRKVAIQGIGGCNHYIAARLFFKDDNLETIDCDTFRELAGHVVNDPSILGIMAIENTIAGSLLQNYRLLQDNRLVIVGEYKLRITHSLVALPGTALEDIREINTHPMAFMQCQEFLDRLPDVKLVEKDDTAGSARWIKENNLRDHAAICPAGAAELYGMEVLAEGIETNKRNFTRFLVLANRDAAADVLKELGVEPENINKSSLVFTLPHTSGSLSKVLTILSFYDMNLSMIQSMPIVGQEWRYQFYVNLLFPDYRRYRQAIDAILPLVDDLEILGEYMEGEQSVK